MPLVSVIVPVYGVEQYLPKCIDSILAQTFPDFELILVDDGSPDGCPAICDEYAAKDSRIRVIHKQNGGVTEARNAALDIACGEYIACCDSDDTWEPQLLEIATNQLFSHGADCILFGINVCTDEGIIRTRSYDTAQYQFQSDDDIVDYLIRVLLVGKHGWSLCAHLFSRAIIERFHIRGCTSCNNFAEDMGFVCSYMLHSKKIISIPDCLYNYYMRHNSMMHKSTNVVRLNDVNEVSYYVEREFYKTIHKKHLQKRFPIIHLMIVNGEISKLFSISKQPQLSAEISKLDRIKYWKKHTTRLLFSHSIVKQHFGAHLANRVLLYATYLKHGNWRLYNLGSAIYYKFYNAFRK